MNKNADLNILSFIAEGSSLAQHREKAEGQVIFPQKLTSA